MIAQQHLSGRLARMRARFARAVLREPSVVLLERDADAFVPASQRADLPPPGMLR